MTPNKDKEKEKKKKKSQIEAEIFSFIQKCMKDAVDEAMKELFQGWK